MGASIVSLDDSVAAQGVAVIGQAASIRPELTAIIVALEDSPGDEELTQLTDSESSITLLQSMPRRDFPLWLELIIGDDEPYIKNNGNLYNIKFSKFLFWFV